MSLLTQASLLVTPNAYKEGKLYSIIPSNGNGDFTATRATTATRVNAAGLIDLVPYNLFAWSEVFSDALWSKGSSSITSNTTTAPNGTLTADTFTADGTLANHRLQQGLTTVTGTAYSTSFYLKKNTNNFAQIYYLAAGFTSNAFANFDLNNGVVGTIGAGTTATIQDVGNGWYRCTITVTAGSSSASAGANVSIVTSATSARSESNSLNTSIFVWGAQLVEGTSARDYLRTETRLNIPRIDYSLGVCPNILLEPQRTNFGIQSEDLSSAAWFKGTGVTITADSAISPSGIQNADRVIGAIGTGTWGSANTLGSATSSLSSNTLYTATIYLRSSSSSSQVTLRLRDQTTGNETTLLCNLTTSWQRFEISRTTGASTTALAVVLTNATADFFAWGRQMEQGAYATSYIPTTTASVTRNADSITRNNIFTNGLITAAGGTWFVEIRNNVARVRDLGVFSLFIGDLLASPNNGLILRNTISTSTRLSISKRISATETTLYTTLNDTVKIAMKWNGATADVFVNGVKQVSATAFTTTNMEFLNCFATDVPKYINQMALFPTPLTDTQCIALTT
jgi:hypothetical protein